MHFFAAQVAAPSLHSPDPKLNLGLANSPWLTQIIYWKKTNIGGTKKLYAIQ